MKQTMKAYVLYHTGKLIMEEVPIPKIKTDEVLVKVMAASICGSDIPRIYQTGAHRHPLIPGHEFSGIVEDIGTHVPKSWLGKRVGVFPLKPCFSCDFCRNKQYELCRNYDYLGSRCDGGFGEYVAVPAWNLIELPNEVSFEQAAMLEPMAVAVHNLRSMLLKTEDIVTVFGLGTIGLLHLLFLRASGVRKILAVGNKEIQKRLALQAGLDESLFFDGRNGELSQQILEHTGQMGADICIECAGRNQTILTALEILAAGGRASLVGNLEGELVLPAQLYGRILRNQLTIRGSWNSSFSHSEKDDWHYAIRKLKNHEIHPETLITHKLPFEQLERGLLIMRDKTEEYVKIMILQK